jgi:hypothetical protein
MCPVATQSVGICAHINASVNAVRQCTQIGGCLPQARVTLGHMPPHCPWTHSELHCVGAHADCGVPAGWTLFSRQDALAPGSTIGDCQLTEGPLFNASGAAQQCAETPNCVGFTLFKGSEGRQLCFKRNAESRQLSLVEDSCDGTYSIGGTRSHVGWVTCLAGGSRGVADVEEPCQGCVQDTT